MAKTPKQTGGPFSRFRLPGLGRDDDLVKEDAAPKRDISAEDDAFGFAHEGHWLTQPDTIRILWIVFGTVLILLVLTDIFIHHHQYFGLDGTFGFYAWYGFITCAAMVLFAKILGIFLKRRDDYYDE